MNQLDKAASESVLRAMAEAGISLEELAPLIGMHEKTLLKRLTQGPWRLVELWTIAQVIGCSPRSLVTGEVAA
ncbi:helix-turn-helix domain-containing protein [Nocardia spumae]|uniref:helix-turn-helix domain-containing protein n=1 Tax=Nocardia spumae TaxID=2887190 RepID=UPI001D13EE1A|nr:helix-turn-helix transcriptional regulator [Nocardia spumae]